MPHFRIGRTLDQQLGAGTASCRRKHPIAARGSHLVDIPYGAAPGRLMGPNQCNTFIPQAASQTVLRQKATLHILDGLIGVYEGGPGNWNPTWGTWARQSLFFATDREI